MKIVDFRAPQRCKFKIHFFVKNKFRIVSSHFNPKIVSKFRLEPVICRAKSKFFKFWFCKLRVSSTGFDDEKTHKIFKKTKIHKFLLTFWEMSREPPKKKRKVAFGNEIRNAVKDPSLFKGGIKPFTKNILVTNLQTTKRIPGDISFRTLSVGERTLESNCVRPNP